MHRSVPCTCLGVCLPFRRVMTTFLPPAFPRLGFCLFMVAPSFQCWREVFQWRRMVFMYHRWGLPAPPLGRICVVCGVPVSILLIKVRIHMTSTYCDGLQYWSQIFCFQNRHKINKRFQIQNQQDPYYFNTIAFGMSIRVVAIIRIISHISTGWTKKKKEVGQDTNKNCNQSVKRRT
jgi:hypothetical protein